MGGGGGQWQLSFPCFSMSFSYAKSPNSPFNCGPAVKIHENRQVIGGTGRDVINSVC